MKNGLAGALACAVCLSAAAVHAQDYDSARIEVETVTDGLHVLFGVGEDVIAGNIGVSIGEQGVLVVDDQFPEMAPKYKASIRELGGGAIDYAINTHWHFDHADGNKVLGPEGVVIVAHENSRRMLTQDNVIDLVSQTIEQPAYPHEALPVATFDDRLAFHFNGQRIDVLHAGPAHTDGDAAVIFRGDNAVHLGDVFNAAGYPFIDAGNGGSLPGMVAFCEAVLAEIDADTVVIPGHGPIGDYDALAGYVEMLATIRDRIAALIDEGATLEQVQAARPTAEWDDANGDPTSFVNRAYTSMTDGR